MAHHFFALISRMRYIGRWGLMRNTFEENIQEHSHMVAVLAHEPLLLEDPESGYHAVVKAADKLSAYIKCVEELKAGNSEFRQAAEQTRQALEASPLPEVGYFLEHFMPGFELTLDELR